MRAPRPALPQAAHGLDERFAAVPPANLTLRGSFVERLSQAVFRRLDANNDGNVDLEDVKLALDANGDGKIDFDDVVHVLDANGDGKFDERDVLEALDFNKDGIVDVQDVLHVLDFNGDGNVDINDLMHLLDLNGDGKVDVKDVEFALDVNKDGRIDYKDVVYAEDLVVAWVEGRVHEAEDRIHNLVGKAEEMLLETEAQLANSLRFRVICELQYRERIEVFFRAVPAVIKASKGLRTRLRRLRRCFFIFFGDFERRPQALKFQQGDSIVSLIIAQVVARHLNRIGQERGFDLDGDGKVGFRDIRALADMSAVISSSLIGAAALDGNTEGAAAVVAELRLAVRSLEAGASTQMALQLEEALRGVERVEARALESLERRAASLPESMQGIIMSARGKVTSAARRGALCIGDLMANPRVRLALGISPSEQAS